MVLMRTTSFRPRVPAGTCNSPRSPPRPPPHPHIGNSTKLAGRYLFGFLGGRVGGKRVDDFLPLRGAGLLQQPEGPKRPGGAGVAQDLVQKELGLRGLEFPGLAAVLAGQESVV